MIRLNLVIYFQVCYVDERLTTKKNITIRALNSRPANINPNINFLSYIIVYNFAFVGIRKEKQIFENTHRFQNSLYLNKLSLVIVEKKIQIIHYLLTC